MVLVTLVAPVAAPGDAAQVAADTAAVATQAPADATAVKAPVAATTASDTASTAATTTAPPAKPSATKSSSGGWLSLLIWAAVLGAVLGFLWSKGYLIRIRNYFAETQEELKKCSWPSREELRGSTVVILVTTVLLGLFTVGVDWILSNLIALIT